jgi:hypothetical protein
MKCGYCLIFQESRDRQKEQIGKDSFKYTRFCNLFKGYVNREDGECEHFIPSSDFSCRRRHLFLSVAICFASRMNALGLRPTLTGGNHILWPECQKCRQFEEIKELSRALGRRKKAEEKAENTTPVLVKRTHIPIEPQQPVLLRRPRT